MSFLDATGLGTFWNKLKSTFQGPVSEVYKDALTPVNILTNSNFARLSNGVSSSQTWDTLTKNTFPVISYGWRFNNPYDLVNVSVTKSSNAITCTGTIADATGLEEATCLGIRMTLPRFPLNTYITLRCSIKDASSNVNYIYASGGTSVTLYSNENNNHEKIEIKKFTSTPSAYAWQVSIDPTVSTTATVTFYDVCVYEGEFKDPPVTTSLDVKAGLQTQFLLCDGSNYPYFSLGGKAFSSNKLYRIIKFNNIANINYYGEILLIKSYNHSRPKMFKIMFSVSRMAATSSTNYFNGYIKINGFTSFSNETVLNCLKSASLSYDANNDVYLNINSGGDTSSNSWYILPLVIPVGYSQSSTGPIKTYNDAITIIGFQDAQSTDTTIASATVTEGF